MGKNHTAKPQTTPLKKTRKRQEAPCKARVALAAIKGAKTASQIAREYGIPPPQVADGKKVLADGVAGVCDKDAPKQAAESFARAHGTAIEDRGVDCEGRFSGKKIQTTRPVSGRAEWVGKEPPLLSWPVTLQAARPCQRGRFHWVRYTWTSSLHPSQYSHSSAITISLIFTITLTAAIQGFQRFP